jgi:RecA-family ATPase
LSITHTDRGALVAAQQAAHSLVDMGMPVFACNLKSNGDPVPPKGWERTKPSHAPVDRWRKGMALCAVTGVVYDVIDIDPRNGGQLSLKRLAKTLGDDGPEIYWEVATASGGKHLYIEKLGIGSHPGFLPGLDLKGGLPDGTSRGFVFIPPTIRPSKADANTGVPVAYRQRQELYEVNGDSSIAALTKFIENPPLEGKVVNAPRSEVSVLRQACLDAQSGEQRMALLRYVHELERKGYDSADILVLLAALVKEMPQFDKRRPWRPDHLQGLLHKQGEVIPDATPDEMGAITPHVRKGGLQSFSSITHTRTQWAMPRTIAFGDATMIDGDAGLGKSLITLDICARFSSGRPMPGEAESHLDGMPVLLLAPEDRASVTAGRIQAALGNPALIFRPEMGLVEIERKDTRGRKFNERRATYDGDMLVFPDAIRKFQRWIKEYGIRMVIIDPVVAFLSERTNSNNDASVRRALEPLCVVLGEVNCAGLLIRHLNKNTNQEARYRGGGSVAFGAVSRIQLLAGELPDGTGRYGLAQIKNNHLERRPDEVLTYSIEDSDIVADEDGNMVPRIRWGEYINMELRSLAGGRKRGPVPERKQEIEQLLEELFSQQDTWPAKEVEYALKEAGLSINRKTVASARDDLGIFARPSYNPDGGIAGWIWTTAPKKYRRGSQTS